MTQVSARTPASAAGRTPLLALALEAERPEPLHRQLYDQLRELVLSGRLAPGSRLPSSRSLAGELGCSRNTVVMAFDQLLSEGYLEGKVGAGTFVSSELPEGMLASDRPVMLERPTDSGQGPLLSRRASRFATDGVFLRSELADAEIEGPAFRTGVPDTDLFPFDIWGRLLGRIWRRPGPELLGSIDPGGLPALQAAIAGHLRTVRGLDCEDDQVLVTAGGQQALDLATRVLLDPGDEVWIEEPGYRGLRAALLSAGARPVPVSVDAEGLSIEEGLALAPNARLAAVAPSHQYPLGITMSLTRRLALLDWARANRAWILEDDYDSEYRYEGRPLAALQGLEAARSPGGSESDENRRVIYVGTFSKVLFPSLRLGYLITPRPLRDAFLRARRALDDHPSAIAQPALAAFIEEGHFAAHIRRMRRIYAARRDVLVQAAGRHLGGLLRLLPDVAGMHLVALMEPALVARMDDMTATRRAIAAGIVVRPLSDFHAGPVRQQGLLLGYAAVPEELIEPAVKRLAEVLREDPD